MLIVLALSNNVKLIPLLTFLWTSNQHVIYVDCRINISSPRCQRYSFIAHDMPDPISFDQSLDLMIHMASRASPFEFEHHPIEILRANTVGIHLHENDGISDQHLEPMKGDIMKYLALLTRIDMILECRNLDPSGIFRNLTAIGRYCGETM